MSRGGADRPTLPKIEITPEMIEAGRDVIASVWTEFTGPSGGLLWGEVLSQVYRAMSEAQRKSVL